MEETSLDGFATAAADGAGEDEYAAELYGDGDGDGYDFAEQQQLPEEPYEYEGYAWDEVTGQYYAIDADDHDATAYYEESGEELSPMAADLFDYGAGEEDSEAVGTLTALTDSVETPEGFERESTTTPMDPAAPLAAPRSSSSGKKPKKKTKTKSERVQMRQEMLEKEEEAKLQQQQSGDATPADGAGVGAAGKAGGGRGTKTPASSSASRHPVPKPTFIEREKAAIRLQIRKARAIACKRMPVQVRILTQPRQQLSPLEKYFGSSSIDAALSDIFWASLKGDLRRVRHLVEIEHVSVIDNKLDPWNMQQTPLHWAAKGGSREVIEYLIGAGASVRCLDENGSFPLHLACWAGHIDAALALLKAGDSRDLYVRDFDAALAPLDWANIRGHTQLLKAIEKLEDSQWLPKFVDDLIRGIIRYKIKLFKPPPKPVKLTAAAAKAGIETVENTQSPGAQATDDPTPAASSTATPSPAPEPTSVSTNVTK